MQPNNPLHLDLKIFELLISKFCHDLAGVIGAINNGAEILQENHISKQVVDLVLESSEDAIGRLKIFRKAYANSDTLTQEELVAYKIQIEDYLKRKNINLLWRVALPDGESHGATISKILFNMAIFAGDILAKNGHLSLAIERAGRQENALHFTAIFAGENINVSDEILNAIMGNISDLGKRNIQAYFLYLIAQNIGAKFIVNNAPGKLTIEAFISP